MHSLGLAHLLSFDCVNQIILEEKQIATWNDRMSVEDELRIGLGFLYFNLSFSLVRFLSDCVAAFSLIVLQCSV